MLPVRSRGCNFFLLVESVIFLYPCRLPAWFIFSQELLKCESRRYEEQLKYTTVGSIWLFSV